MPDDFEERQRNPKFDLIEQHFGHPVPASLRRLYANPEELNEQDFTITLVTAEGSRQWFVGDISPIDESSLEFFEGFERFIEFANDASEGVYFIDPTQAEPDVAYFDMESYELTPCGCTLSEFLAAPRREGYPDDDDTE